MSMLISNCDQISRAPTNTSKAKMLYMFGKSARFKQDKQNECHEFYEMNCVTSRRGTSLGYGKKYDFMKEVSKNPSPDTYNIESIFLNAKRKKKGFIFGNGRAQMKSTGVFKKNQNPGPGSYEPSDCKSTIKHSMKGKNLIEDKEPSFIPGPGTYEENSMFNKTGQQFCSKYRSKGGCKFGLKERMKNEKNVSPGPGSYEYKNTELSPEGKYFISRLKSAKGVKFGHSTKLSASNTNRCKTPGPGTYRLPSEFGYYINRSTYQQNRLATRSNPKYNHNHTEQFTEYERL